MSNYMTVISVFYPNTEATCEGDPSVYENITFHSSPITKADLDNKSLDLHKINKKEAIDLRTKELILGGITYDNVVFSSSETAQRNWLALDQFKDYHTYPVAVTAEDDSEYTFADATAISNFVLTGMSIINGHYASGRALKVQVNNATTIAEVDAVVDNR